MAADPALVGLPDEQVLEWATDQGRCLVTENVKDFGPRPFPRAEHAAVRV
ncbi:MAG TPA: DUF5615 family PIN-like protein [Actinomycetota bacterium]